MLFQSRLSWIVLCIAIMESDHPQHGSFTFVLHHGLWRRYAFAFGDKTTPANSPGINSLLNGAISDNNPFVGTRYFGLHNFPNNQYYLWFFQWTVSAPAHG